MANDVNDSIRPAPGHVAAQVPAHFGSWTDRIVYVTSWRCQSGLPVRLKASYDPGKTVLLPALGVACAAVCVWLGVRIVNRRERWAKWMLAILLILSIFGWLWQQNPPPASFIYQIDQPL